MKKKKLRIHINSNAQWSTSGYGQQIAELLPLIRDEGYPVAITNFFGQTGGKFILDGILQLPAINHVYGSDALVEHGKFFKSDVNFTLQDIWPLNDQDLERVNRFIPICPVDHDPVPQIVLDKLRFAYRIVTYSRFGQKQLENNGFYSTFIPHTVNTNIFKPIQDKKTRKTSANLPEDCFLVGVVAANKDNPPRKSFQEILDAFKMFLQKEPKALLYIHTNPQFVGGFPVDHYARYIGIQDKVLFPDVYKMSYETGKEEMNLIYNSFDVFLIPSVSEGFCVPIIEAMSCGVPVITNDYTAMKELVEDGVTGYKTKVLRRRWTQVQSYVGEPDTKDIYKKLVQIHSDDRIKMGKNCRKFIIDNYDTKYVFDSMWKPFLHNLENEIYGHTSS